VQSVSENRNQMFRVPMSDPLQQTSATGGYPWRIEDTSTTISYIKNMTDLEQEYIASLTWENGGHYVIGLKKIKPHETIEIDVKNLRDEQTTDFRGTTIPLNISSGQIKWSLRQQYQTDNLKNDSFALIGRNGQIDMINNVSSSYACQNCCSGGDVDAFITTDPFGSRPSGDDYEFEIGEVVQYYPFIVHQDCYGNEESCPIGTDDWSSNHTNIATVNSSGLVTILGIGDVQIEADAEGYLNLEGPGCLPGEFLTEACEDQFEQKTEKTKTDSLAPPCVTCDYLPTDFDPKADISITPKVIMNVPASAFDGDTVSFNATIENGTASAYLWSFDAPGGAGNNPQVNFTAPTSNTTMANAHWFAKPNGACSARANFRLMRYKFGISER
jgi:hypothetical protein